MLVDRTGHGALDVRSQTTVKTTRTFAAAYNLRDTALERQKTTKMNVVRAKVAKHFPGSFWESASFDDQSRLAKVLSAGEAAQALREPNRKQDHEILSGPSGRSSLQRWTASLVADELLQALKWVSSLPERYNPQKAKGRGVHDVAAYIRDKAAEDTALGLILNTKVFAAPTAPSTADTDVAGRIGMILREVRNACHHGEDWEIRYEEDGAGAPYAGDPSATAG